MRSNSGHTHVHKTKLRREVWLRYFQHHLIHDDKPDLRKSKNEVQAPCHPSQRHLALKYQLLGQSGNSVAMTLLLFIQTLQVLERGEEGGRGQYGRKHTKIIPCLSLATPFPFLFSRLLLSSHSSRSSSSFIILIISFLLFSLSLSSFSRARLLSSRPANHSSRARSSSSGLACSTIQVFMASRCFLHTQVAVTVRLIAQAANSRRPGDNVS